MLSPQEISRHAWENGAPFFVPESVTYLEGLVTSNWKVFEWGAGASTIWCNKKFVGATSIEHDPQWFERVSRRLEQEGSGVVDLRLIPLGDEYVQAIRDFPDSYFDLVLVDGRIRVRCMVEAIPKVKWGGVLVLDNSERARYASGIAALEGWGRQDFGSSSWLTSIFRRTR